MDKTAWIFPGQGAQFVGMGQELCRAFPAAASVFETADRVLGNRFSSLVFEGPESELTLTKNAQPAILAVGVACARVLNEKGLRPDMAAGLSLGEYTALVVAGSLSLEDALVITRKRGLHMQEACPEGLGAMAAVIGLSPAEVESLCYDARNLGVVTGANYNCPGQIVISGHKKAVEKVCASAMERGAKCVPLTVSAPFHSPLMEEAAERLKRDLDKIEIRMPGIPVYANVDGAPLKSPEHIRESLIKQVTHPVLWQVSVESMLRDGAGRFIELGPGKTLTGFLKRIAPQIPARSFLTPKDLDSTIDLSKGASLL
ncbi:MAG TPA: ACP S-malonyltransferase [Firmicutes bacterium]|nr:ACP S-malonyltransferase [Candidatus Fermentithermobacillaceae bacterium]